MKRIWMGVAIGLALVLAGCSAIDEGVVTDKHYSEAYDYYTTDCKMWRTDSKGYMSCAFYGPTYHHVPASWKLDLRKGEDEGWVYVSEGVYSQTEIGKYYRKEK